MELLARAADTAHNRRQASVLAQVAMTKPPARERLCSSSLSPIQEDTADGKTEFMGDKPSRSLLCTRAKEGPGYGQLTMRPADASSQCGAKIRTVVEGSSATGTEKGDDKGESSEMRSSHGPSTQKHRRV
jgi:hypothetical protein